ncbi:MAG: lytic murein transglycosylase [Deltaproteobacteria bacterium]|nr:lytic murein transglycosylase [Deltaproteobacteria bacterium]
MNIRNHFTRIFLSCGAIGAMTICFWMASMLPAASEDRTAPFNSLQARLAGEGFDPVMLKTLFQKQDVHFEARTMSLFFMHSEARVNYDQFLSPDSLQKARNYIQEHLSDLDTAEKTFGVNKEVITAIMLVETRLGTYLGASSILNTLSSLASMKDSGLRELVWNAIQPERRPDKSVFEEKANSKSEWAYQELKAFLKYTGREKIDPTTIFGSYAGAMGIAQFMPSNILTYAMDGNHDGRIDLFDPSDAIASIANYLKRFGWKPGISYEAAFDVVYHYNHSKVYVTTILKIADQLKG